MVRHFRNSRLSTESCGPPNRLHLRGSSRGMAGYEVDSVIQGRANDGDHMSEQKQGIVDWQHSSYSRTIKASITRGC